MLRLGCTRSISCGLRAFVPPQECAKFGAVDRVVIPRPPKSAFFLLHGRTNRTFVSLALPPLPPLQGLHRVVLSDSTALCMDGTGPPKLGVGTADSRLPLSDAQGCNVMRAPSARLRTSVCTRMLLGPLWLPHFRKRIQQQQHVTVTLSGKAFVRFLSVEGASKALLGIHGRRFASRENRHPRADTDACAYANNAATKPSSASRPTLPRADSPSTFLGSL